MVIRGLAEEFEKIGEKMKVSLILQIFYLSTERKRQTRPNIDRFQECYKNWSLNLGLHVYIAIPYDGLPFHWVH